MERLIVDVVQFCCAIAKFLLLDQRLSIAYTFTHFLWLQADPKS